MNTEGYRAGVEGALIANAHHYKFIEGSLDAPSPGETEDEREYRTAYRTGYLSEMARIANRKTSESQREFLAAHDEAARVWREGVGPSGCIVRNVARFAEAQKELYATVPWAVLGIRLAQWANPNRQAYGA